ncbi:uncharacterized protein A1O9_11391 [Exophiala aquamarina CBS 119918]|uniref:Major facilitator superfamily (MFS) profile domain-containing protein n=1 Tax=Exophiala aquamarina CBS 119918 TaxID=1182545 RepID=A0A072NXE6_9EURO|nr:uncharacterized protein A1O9_11391 [Exophiala aquamarina CBS 119918]KEF52549.1 hypothetical protein A1O9_11391 [Exophiala aquamarina CBS 119918]
MYANSPDPVTGTDADLINVEHNPKSSSIEEKGQPGSDHLERVVHNDQNLHYDEVDQEPELHARTWLALTAMMLLNMVQVVALTGPPVVLSYIGASLGETAVPTWVPNALSLVQAVLGPIIAAASDTFQARKLILVCTSTISFIGAAIAPGSKDIYRLIVAQTIIGVGFAAVPLAYAVPSEILPRRWRPFAQAGINVSAALGSILGPLSIGAFTRSDPVHGWRNFYWLQMALWGATALSLLLGYRPPKRHTRLDHLSIKQKLSHLDLPGFALFTAGLTLLLTGINLGGQPWPWASVRVLAPLIIGIVTLVAFGIYEWKGTPSGILHHDLFRGGKSQGRAFTICVGLIVVEAITGFTITIFYPILNTLLFETDPFLLAVRSLPYAVMSIISSVICGYLSVKFKSIRWFIFFGFLVLTGTCGGFAAIQPDGNIAAMALSGLSGLGLGPPLILIIVGVQLSTPHRLIATATAVTSSARAVAAAVFTAIVTAVFNNRVASNVPAYTAQAAAGAGLPPDSLPAFIKALLANDAAALAQVPGASLAIIGASVRALHQAFADSVRIVFIIATPFGLVACIACFFLGSVSSTMNYKVDAPVEDLHAKKADTRHRV